MGSRKYRNQFTGQIDTALQAVFIDGGEALQHLRDVSHIQPDIFAVSAPGFADDSAGYYIARSQFFQGMIASHKGFPLDIIESSSFPTHRFGYQKTLLLRGKENGGMKLNKLQIGQAAASSKSRRHSICGGHRGIGSVFI